MKPRIQRVLTQWKPGFIASWRRAVPDPARSDAVEARFHCVLKAGGRRVGGLPRGHRAADPVGSTPAVSGQGRELPRLAW